MDKKIQDPLIVSAIFFAVSSTWFDDWVRSMFPSLAENTLLLGLVKTLIFAGLYWFYTYSFRGNAPKTGKVEAAKTETTTTSSRS